jgi:hypothetical protein
MPYSSKITPPQEAQSVTVTSRNQQDIIIESKDTVFAKCKPDIIMICLVEISLLHCIAC